METTCGFFIRNASNMILIVHPTNSPDSIWSIPKGRKEMGESELEAAYREVLEETNIDLTKYNGNIIPLGIERYKSGRKQLCGFVFEYDGIFTDTLKCESMVKGLFPEVDKYRWVTYQEAFELLHHTQQELLEKYISNLK